MVKASRHFTLPAPDRSVFSPPRPFCARPPLCACAPSPPLSFSPPARAASAHAPVAFSTLSRAAVAVTRQERATMSARHVWENSGPCHPNECFNQHGNHLGEWIKPTGGIIELNHMYIHRWNEDISEQMHAGCTLPFSLKQTKRVDKEQQQNGFSDLLSLHDNLQEAKL